ncbi:MAG: SDR family oxidoreductase [Clostridia bacterium]|nr:SDR family oxidoreductase [Clostridia bacterium]
MSKTAVITGASRGIGAQCARLFAQNGYNVVINYCSSEQKARELCDELLSQGFSAAIVKADVSVSAQASGLIDKAVELFGGVDVLINNAGIGGQRLITDVTDEIWEHMIGVNLNAAFYCTRRALQHMINKKSGRIINISSIWGICGASCEVHYSAAKAGIIGFTKALAKEVGPSGITVNCIAPGVIDTDMNKALSSDDLDALCDETPIGRLGTADDIARLALFLSEGGGSFITGQVISPNGGFVI